MENNAAVKEELLNEGVESNAKSPDDPLTIGKVYCLDDIRDPRKRKRLPYVVYELLKLFKQSENDDPKVEEKTVRTIAC